MDRHPSGARTGARKSARRDHEGLWDWNLVSNRIHFSPGWIALVGCQDHEVGSTPEEWLDRVHPDDSEQLLRDIEATRADGSSDFDLRYRLRHKDGTYRWMCSRGLVIRNDDGDATRLTGTQADITVETVTDRLTGLPNRLLLLDRLTQSIARARRHPTFQFALMLVELGRPSGQAQRSQPAADPLLSGAARRLETCLRMPDAMSDLRLNDLVARVDGDQFAVLLDGLSGLNHAKDVAERILAEMLAPFSVGSQEVQLAPSIGIALSATRYTTPDEAMRDAETALHRARMLGGSHCAVFDADALKAEESALHLEGELELALQRGEFELVYQPIVSLVSNAVVGFEALVRWRHSELGVISPLDFIPIAERTGMIVPLGQWILQEACLQLKVWQAGVPAARDVWMSVNLSGAQLGDGTLAEQVEQALRNADLEARSLVLELTEGVAMDNPVAVTTLLMRLRAMGVRISIDDFGTGYSSLAYLRQFPVDSLKIDQSFVRSIANDKDTAAIVTSIVAMAKELGLSVVAEGVEKEAQLAMLRSLHCESVQGYLFAEPLDAKSAEGFLRYGPAVPVASLGLPIGNGDRGIFSLPRLWSAVGLPEIGRHLLMAGAVVVVLATAGVGAIVYREYRIDTGAVPSAEAAPVTRTDPFEIDYEALAPPGLAKNDPPPPLAPAQPGIAPSAPTLWPGLPPAATRRSAGPVARTTFEVEHLHRMGKCRGRLIVSVDGLEFEEQKATGESFILPHGEFVHTVDKGTLTIRTAAKAYRFTTVVKPSREGDDAQLARMADTIIRSRAR
jgi:diguanylate cyclase (GGDEF)-like protein